jgi:hypothetical protein
MLRSLLVGYGLAAKARLVAVRQGMLASGMVWQHWRRMPSHVRVSRGAAVAKWLGRLWVTTLWSGQARQ